MTKKLQHSRHDIARQIFSVFQRSYLVEAQIIGVKGFPPLARTIEDIRVAETGFYGYFCDDRLAAVIEISCQSGHLDICSLTVDPDFFRRGIAGRLLQFVLHNVKHRFATVETAVSNRPAILLYEKHGFVKTKEWTPSHGIPKVAFKLTACDRRYRG